MVDHGVALYNRLLTVGMDHQIPQPIRFLKLTMCDIVEAPCNWRPQAPHSFNDGHLPQSLPARQTSNDWGTHLKMVFTIESQIRNAVTLTALLQLLNELFDHAK